MKRFLAFLTIGLSVLIDQLLKRWAVNFLMPIDTYPIIEDIFHFTYVENRGAAFGMFQGQKWLTIGMTALVVIAGFIYIALGKLDKTPYYLYPIAFILGGGIGNLIDRVAYGYVVDFIHVKVINFAVFNFADICVTCGTIAFIAALAFADFKKNPKKQAEITEETAETPDAEEQL